MAIPWGMGGRWGRADDGLGQDLAAWSPCLGLVTFLLKAAWRPHKSLWFLRSLIIHHRMRTQNGQQKAQEAFFFFFFLSAKPRAALPPSRGTQRCFYESLIFPFPNLGGTCGLTHKEWNQNPPARRNKMGNWSKKGFASLVAQ